MLFVASLVFLGLDGGLQHIAERFSKASSVGELIAGRPEIWRQTVHMITDNPWLGLGPEIFKYELNHPGSFWHPHNVILQLWVESGIVGLLIFISILWLLGSKIKTELITSFTAHDNHLIKVVAT